MSKHYLVTEPGLTALAFAQRLTSQQLAQALAEYGEDSFIVAPYTQKLQRKLRSEERMRF